MKQKSLYVWIDKFPIFTDESRVTSKEDFERHIKASILSDEAKALIKTYSAFTVAELIYMLQEISKEDIIVGWSDNNVADHLAQQLCTKLQNLKENAGSGLTH